ncbi:MAG TPA: DNA polymerase/3'-5' exonuclease PolX [Thermoanaerobaculia bacterium]|nr:DNA polymerase/3'-5' exonuclease PolX [Thermoanaerobaculia bacterium]
MDNPSIARALAEVADLLEIEGANPFRVRAYRNAVRTIETQTVSLADQVAAKRELTALPGIGKEMARHVVELVETGELSLREELLARLPRGLVEVMRLPGVGARRAKKLWDELGTATVDEVEAAAQAGRVRGVAGFGATSERKILAGIAEWRQHGERLRLDLADRHLEPLLATLRAVPGAARVEVAGSYRRRRETVGDVDLLAIPGSPAAAGALLDAFVAYPQVAEVLGRGDTKASVRLGSGLQVDLRVVGPESYGAALQYFTGSKEHNVRLRQRAIERGLKLSEYGLFRGEERVAGAEEAEVYAALGLPWIPPELREDRGELAAAERGGPPRLVEVGDLRGDLQMHSTWSDGKASIEDMLVACAARGYEYFALTDHSKALPMIGGLDAVRLRAQWEEIAEVRARHPEIRLLRSMEVDILADGRLDLEDELLAGLDLVVVSIHSRFDLPAAEQTERILRAVAHPEVDVLAHPMGRRIGQRKPMDFDVEAVLAACREHGVAVEANASPQRLDLPDVHLARARELGVPVVISTDAHSVAGLDAMRYGVDQARRAGLTAGEVLNARGWEGFERWLRRREGGGG